MWPNLASKWDKFLFSQFLSPSEVLHYAVKRDVPCCGPTAETKPFIFIQVLRFSFNLSLAWETIYAHIYRRCQRELNASTKYNISPEVRKMIMAVHLMDFVQQNPYTHARIFIVLCGRVAASPVWLCNVENTEGQTYLNRNESISVVASISVVISACFRP